MKWRVQTFAVVWLAIGLGFVPSLDAQTLTDTSEGVVTLSIPFGNLTPGTSSTPSTTQVQFKLRDSNSSGYHVEASASFSVTPTSSVSGGNTLTASDIGVGISLTFGQAVNTPRTDTIATGFNYNPGSITATNGLSPFTGKSSGRATLADLVSNPNITILSGPRIAANENTNNANNCITVTMTFGLLGQFFTPATFSGTLTLTLKNGP